MLSRHPLFPFQLAPLLELAGIIVVLVLVLLSILHISFEPDRTLYASRRKCLGNGGSVGEGLQRS